MNENNNQTSIFDVLSGRESVKVDISIDWVTLTVLGAAIVNMLLFCGISQTSGRPAAYRAEPVSLVDFP